MMTAAASLVSPAASDLSGKVALVSGASSGLGAHFASVLAAAGATVYLGARRMDRLTTEAERIRDNGGAAEAIPLDVSDPVGIDAAVAEIIADTGRIDILVNNAGIGVIKPALEHTLDDWENTLRTDLTGSWLLAQATGRHMVAAGSGSIINIASLAGLGVTRSTSAYSAAKAGIVHLTRQLALEWARSGVRVNCLCPGHFATELNAAQMGDPEVMEALARRVPLGRIGELRDLDAPLLLLAGNGSRYITGAVIPVDGGQLVRSL